MRISFKTSDLILSLFELGRAEGWNFSFRFPPWPDAGMEGALRLNRLRSFGSQSAGLPKIIHFSMKVSNTKIMSPKNLSPTKDSQFQNEASIFASHS